NPNIERVLIWDKSVGKYKHLKALIRTIRETKYDVLVNLQRFTSSGIITVLSGAKVKLGFSKNPLSLFFTRSVKHTISTLPSKSAHEVDRNLSVIDLITDRTRNFPIKLYPSKTDSAKVSQFKTSKYICIAPTSLWFTKQYPKEKWIEFLKSIDSHLYVYFLGSANDIKVCNQLIQESGHHNSINLSGKLSFLESAALMKDASMNFVNDSAPQHFASAMNAPVTAIFCSTVPAFGFGPLSDDAVIIESDEGLKCRPCGLHGFNTCPENHFKCALTIKNEKILARVK
nr:glycosyltransferase family 9 protein [Bacteroidota bacterium]